jgi:hypothetical protein
MSPRFCGFGGDLDTAYMERWIGELDLRLEWGAALSSSQPRAVDPDKGTPPA